jgi:hypothetical protein
VPTFAEYVPVVSAAVSAGTRRAYGSYWNRVIEHWGDRRLDEPSPSEIRQLMTYVKTHVVTRRNARGGRSAEEHLVAALRCLYRRAVDDGLIGEADNPARKVRSAVSETRSASSWPHPRPRNRPPRRRRRENQRGEQDAPPAEPRAHHRHSAAHRADQGRRENNRFPGTRIARLEADLAESLLAGQRAPAQPS